MRNKIIPVLLFISIFFFSHCSLNKEKDPVSNSTTTDSLAVEDSKPISINPEDIKIEKTFLYDQYTLEDSYPYKDTTRMFQWDKVRKRLALLDSIQQTPATWAILENYKNKNGEAPLVKTYKRDEYKRISDTLGVERYQGIPLYLPNDSITPLRYGRDGALVKIIKDSSNFTKIATVYFTGEWLVPQKYIKVIGDTVTFKKAIIVDRTNQNIMTLEKEDSKWLVRSMNPATTGLHNPPYAQETPLGMFVVQEKKVKMVYLADGSKETGGYAPYASRFTNGGYLHGVPVNVPHTKQIEFSASLGTTPRSHMCVRNATSHAKFMYDWVELESTIVFVID